MKNVLRRFRIGGIFKANLSSGDGLEVGFVEGTIELIDVLAHVFARPWFAKTLCDGVSDVALSGALRADKDDTADLTGLGLHVLKVPFASSKIPRPLGP